MLKDALSSALIGGLRVVIEQGLTKLALAGLDTLEKRLNGRATDEELLAWLRDAQDGSA